MSKYLDTRDLYKRQQELEDLKSAVKSAAEELSDAEKALADHASGEPGADSPEWEAWNDEDEELSTAVDDAQASLDSAQEEYSDDEKQELAELDDLESEVGEWRDGNTLIPESDFEDYARQYAEDIGAIPDNAQWPCTCIDWKQAAKELAMDYSTVTYQGTDYLVRD